MRATLSALLALITACAAAELTLKQVSLLPLRSSSQWDYLSLFDTDHDGLGEVIHNPDYYFQIAEYRPVNRFVLVVSDTSPYPAPESIIRAKFWPHDVGDVDRDGLADLVGRGSYYSGGGYHYAVCVFESHDSFSYPDSLVWWVSSPISAMTRHGVYANLDGDSAWDIAAPWEAATAIFENAGNNRESLVCTVPCFYYYPPAVGDFDQNGRTDIAFRDGDPYGQREDVVECIGDNEYTLACTLHTGWSTNNDRFAGGDVDRNGRPEYFEQFYWRVGGLYSQTLCQFEASSEHQYFCDTVDTVLGINSTHCGHSLCADVDGDSLEEIVWGCGNRLLILQATGSHQYERVYDDPYMGNNLSMCNAADFNRNGYKEIFVGGDRRSFVLEVECIRVLSPDTNHFLRSGDTCEIRWQVLSPPRCDSVSLFLLTDTVVPTGEWFWRLDTIATGLAPTESSYLWVVPDTQLVWAKVLAIAYGPGWQFDESYLAFQIAPVGTRETPTSAPADWALSVSPNPAGTRTVVSYDVPVASEVRLSLFDASGRVAAELVSGRHRSGRYAVRLSGLGHDPKSPGGFRSCPAPGVYFLRLDAQRRSLSFKVVVSD